MKKLGINRAKIASGQRADMPAWKVQAFRDKWRRQGYVLPPWENRPRVIPPKESSKVPDGTRIQHPSQPPDKSTIGTVLQRLVKEKWGGVECGECKREIIALNQKSADEVRSEREELADRIVSRAKVKALKFWQRWGATVDGVFGTGIARRQILPLIDQAIEEGKDPPVRSVPVKGKRKRRRRNGARRVGRKGAFRVTKGPFEFVTTARLWEDAKALVAQVPHDVVAIAGIARSGLNVGTMLSMMLQLPLYAVRQNEKDIVRAGSGWRIGRHGDPSGRILVVDDTVMMGNTYRDLLPLIRSHWPNVVTSAVYVNPNADPKPDFWARDLPWPHLLEWNLFNSVLSKNVAMDFDGVLCRDCPPQDDDDGPRYLEFLRKAQPLYLSRREPIPLIVTARLEKYRWETEEWLRRWGVRWHQLAMAPWATLEERRKQDIAKFKAEHFKNWAKRHRASPPPLMFIESDDRQAQRIARLSRQLVVCPSTARCYQ